MARKANGSAATTSTPTVSTELLAQRQYYTKVQQMGFEFGLTVADAFIRGIRDIGWLIGQYGGTVKGWVKKCSPPLVVNGRPAEIHWYEAHGVGRREIKIKRILD